MCGPSVCELFSRRSNSAPPPTASNSGHSTSPATPIAPSVNAAAGVEWLPLVDALLHTRRGTGHGADDAVDRGTTHCARGRGGC